VTAPPCTGGGVFPRANGRALTACSGCTHPVAQVDSWQGEPGRHTVRVISRSRSAAPSTLTPLGATGELKWRRQNN
jgi:hypothetical protein